MFSPTGTFFAPGMICAVIGGSGLFGLTLRDILAVDTWPWLTSRHMLTALLFWLMGTGILGLGIVAQEADYRENYDSANRAIAFMRRIFSLEKGLILGSALIFIGSLVLAYMPMSYYTSALPRGSDLLRLDAAVLAIAAILTGVQCVFTSFALGVFYLRVK